MPLDSLLSQLENAQLIRQLSEPDLAYIFKHALSQQAAYQSLLTKNRREIHQLVAQSYEKLYADHLDEYAALLAHHYAEGGDPARAFVYEIRAGDVSARLFANAEAIGHYTRALEIGKQLDASEESSLKDIYIKRGRVSSLN